MDKKAIQSLEQYAAQTSGTTVSGKGATGGTDLYSQLGKSAPAPVNPLKAAGDEALGKIMKKYKTTPLNQGIDIGKMAQGAMGDVGKGIGDVAGNIGNVAQAANPFSGEDLGQRAGRLGQTAMNAARPMIDTAMEAGQNVAGGFGDIYQGLTGAGSQDLGQRLGNVGKGFGRITGAQTDLAAGATPIGQLGKSLGLQGAAQGSAQFYGDTGKAAGQGIQNTVGGLGNIGTGIGQLQKGDQTGWDNILRKGLFQGASGASNAVFSPIAGAMGTLPEFAKQGLGQVAKGGEYLVDESMRSAGLDPNSIQGQNVKAGLQALMDVGSLGAGKVVGGALKSGKLGATAAKAAEATAAFSGKAAQQFDNLIKNAVKGVKTGIGNVASKGLDTASNVIWTTPSATMKKIYENGDDFLKVIDDPLMAQSNAFSRLGSSIDDAISTTKSSGKGYDTFRKSGQSAVIPTNPVLESFGKFGLEFKGGKLVPKGGKIENTTFTPEEITHLNKSLVPALPIGKTLTADQFLNLRTKLSNMSKFDMGATGRTDAVRNLVREVRGVTNDAAKNVFTGLKELDAKFSEAKGNLKEMQALFMKKDPVTKQYVIKPNIQPETISNLLSPRNRGQLQKLEKTAPGITQELEMLHLAKQVEGAANITTGAGLKRVIAASTGTGMGGPLGTIAGLWLSDPMVAAKMFARVGKMTNGAAKATRGAKETVKNASKVKQTAKKGAKTFADAISNQQQQN